MGIIRVISFMNIFLRTFYEKKRTLVEALIVFGSSDMYCLGKKKSVISSFVKTEGIENCEETLSAVMLLSFFVLNAS